MGWDSMKTARSNRGPLRHLLVVVLVTGWSALPALANPEDAALEKAGLLMASGQATEALRLCQETRVEYPESSRLLFAIGSAQAAVADQLLQQQSAAKAAEHWTAARDTFLRAERENRLGAAAVFNAATCLLKLDATFDKTKAYEARVANLRAAVAAFEDCLERYPEEERARKNLDYARYALLRVLQNPPSEEESEESEGEDEPGDVVELTTATTEIAGATAEVVDGSTVVLHIAPREASP